MEPPPRDNGAPTRRQGVARNRASYVIPPPQDPSGRSPWLALIVHSGDVRAFAAPVTTLLRVHLADAVIGLPAVAVREILRAVAITPVPGAPRIIEGTINVRGEVIAVVDVRRRLSLPNKQLEPHEFLVVLHVDSRTFAFRVDDVDDLVDTGDEMLQSAEGLSPALSGLAGLAARPDGVLVIQDPGAFVSQAEIEALDAASVVQ